MSRKRVVGTKLELPPITLYYSRKLKKREAIQEAIAVLNNLLNKKDKILYSESKLTYTKE